MARSSPDESSISWRKPIDLPDSIVWRSVLIFKSVAVRNSTNYLKNIDGNIVGGCDFGDFAALVLSL